MKKEVRSDLALKGKPKVCDNTGCNVIIEWYHDDATEDEYFMEIGANGEIIRRHRCSKWNPQSSTTGLPQEQNITAQLDKMSEKLCIYQCGIRIKWNNEQRYFEEVHSGQRHICPNYRRPFTTTTAAAAASVLDSSSNVSTAEQTMLQILQIVQRIERILSDSTTPQT
jgi:hypothetical protein